MLNTEIMTYLISLLILLVSILIIIEFDVSDSKNLVTFVGGLITYFAGKNLLNKKDKKKDKKK
jgi:positive regulator of sigma E activity